MPDRLDAEAVPLLDALQACAVNLASAPEGLLRALVEASLRVAEVLVGTRAVVARPAQIGRTALTRVADQTPATRTEDHSAKPVSASGLRMGVCLAAGSGALRGARPHRRAKTADQLTDVAGTAERIDDQLEP